MTMDPLLSVSALNMTQSRAVHQRASQYHLVVDERRAAIYRIPDVAKPAPRVEVARARVRTIGVEANRIGRPRSRDANDLVDAAPANATTLVVRADRHVSEVHRTLRRREVRAV